MTPPVQELSQLLLLTIKKIQALEARIALLENKDKQEKVTEIPVISREDMPEMITCSLCKISKPKRVFKSTDSRCLKCRSGII